jgi:enamine deaminase RidA (YjgF/YER057c/UK114 family)
MSREIIQTANAPSAIGTYVQAVQTPPGSMVFISGQIPLLPTADPAALALVSAEFSEQAHQVFIYLAAVASE